MSLSFWSPKGRAGWPRDCDGFVFLGRAVDRMGRAMFGTDWTDDTMIAVYKGPSPPSKPLRRPVRMAVLPARIPNLDPQLEAAEDAVRPLPSRDDSSQLIHALRALAEVNRKRAALVGSMQERVINAASRGDLAFAFRQDGRMKAVEARLWNEPGVETRFARCTFDPAKPFYNSMLPGANHRDLYVTEASLHDFLRMQPEAELVVGSGDLSSFSPLLQFAVRLALKWKTDSAWTPPKRDALTHAVQQEWKQVHGTDLTPTRAEYIGWILKHP